MLTIPFSQYLAYYSSPNFGEFATFLKEYQTRLNRQQSLEILPVEYLLDHHWDIEVHCCAPMDVLENWKDSRSCAITSACSSRIKLLKRWLKGTGLHSSHMDRINQVGPIQKGHHFDSSCIFLQSRPCNSVTEHLK
ncbi:hypothetical protein TNCT_714171 [Trichonephila clavata]|uniref:Uncharacterized protein n=1 Tax=Trichonephila clavata TaxID=2740835 RepID=A0A8X6LSV6_TRICU|nr:hypothetical protein TNCT_714171 [Trichonephila clavata]